MNEPKLCLVHCILFVVVYVHSIHGARKGLRIDRMEPCGTSDNPPFTWDDIQIYHLPSGLSSISSTWQALRDLPTFYMSIDILRCASKEALDTCESITKLRKLDTCQILSIKGVGWSSYVNAFTPPLRCPFKKGKYVGKNCTLDPNLAMLIPLEDWYWKFKVNVAYDNEYMNVCLEFKTYIIR